MEKSFDKVPIIDLEDECFEDKLNFNLWSTQSCSDYSNSRDRPYDGQPHTDYGERGKTEIKGITFRDLRDCFVKGFLLACHDSEIYTKVEKGTWREQDVYNACQKDPGIDPIAAAQNMSNEIEKMMGIYPNVPELIENDVNDFLENKS